MTGIHYRGHITNIFNIQGSIFGGIYIEIEDDCKRFGSPSKVRFIYVLFLQVSIKIPVSPLCDLWCVVVDVIARVGKLNNEKNDGKMIVSASERSYIIIWNHRYFLMNMYNKLECSE